MIKLKIENWKLKIENRKIKLKERTQHENLKNTFEN